LNRKEKVYAFLRNQATVPLFEDEIASMLDVPKRDRNELALILEELTVTGEIQCQKGRFFVKKSLSDDAMLSSILESHGFPESFPPEILAAADKVPASVRSTAGRRDLRSLLTFTIDGPDARDFDDAISIEETPDGFRLYVHIADVAHYVKNNGVIDREAYSRGTSCYLPGRVVPMLPAPLSNGICSLNPDVDRLTLTTVIDLTRNGRVLSFEICEAVIRSDFRLVYGNVSAMLDRGKPEKGYEAVFPSLKLLDALSDALSAHRHEKGSIDFGVPEPEIVLNEAGRVTAIEKRTEGRADRMIENCMVLCNQVIAEYIFHLDAPFVYRVHEAPDGEKLERLGDALRTLSLSFPGRFSGQKASTLLESIEGDSRSDIVRMLLLRAMMKARYSHENTGHFGLALTHYCHFTSPIRRYPDLMCHRVVKAVLHGKDTARLAGKIRRSAVHSSEREEAAVEAEREAVRYLMCRYMEDYVGEEYTAVIMSVLDFGFFVALPNLAEGLVHVRDLGEDYFVYNEKTLSLSGRRTGKVYRLGDAVEVRLARVDSALSRIDFELKEAEDRGKNHSTKQKGKT